MGVVGPFGFVGGMNTKAYAPTLGQSQMPDGQNCYVIYTSLFKRNGSIFLNSSALNSAASITGLYDWLANSGTRFQLAVAGSKIYSQTALGGTFTDITGAATITAGNNNLHTFSSLNNIVIICGGTTPDTPLQWTGTGNVASLSGSPPVGNITVTANNFVFITGTTANPSRIYWSNVGDPQTWPATQYVDFRPSDGDSVTALADLNQNLVIFKRRSIGILFTQTGTVAGAVTLAPLTQIPSYVGAAGPLCWDHLPNGAIVFLGSNSHAYIFDGANVIDISDTAPPESNFQSKFDALNLSRLQYSCVQTYPTLHQVWFSVSTGSNSTNNIVYVYDYVLEAWMPPFTNIAANAMEACVDNRSTPDHAVTLITGTYGGFVAEQDKGTTNAEVSDGSIDGYGTASVILGTDQTDFIPKSLIVYFEGQTVNALLNINYGFNDYTSTGQTFQIQTQQMGQQLDLNFILDQSELAGGAITRVVIPLTNSDRVYSMQVQFRIPFASQPFIVHPFYISDDVIT